MPLFYDIYPGNRNDAKQFPLMLKRFHDFLNDTWKELTLEMKSEPQEQLEQTFPPPPPPPQQQQQQQQQQQPLQPQVTLVFDKGNNSADNFVLIDSLNFNYVGSVKLEEHKELAQISNSDDRFRPCSDDDNDELEGTKSFRVKKFVYGKERILIVTYNQNLFNTQFLTIQNDITKAMEKLSLLQQKLEDRANGLIKGGKSPTKESVENQCKKILTRQYMKDVIKVKVSEAVVVSAASVQMQKEQKKTTGIGTVRLRLDYSIDSEAISKLSDTYLGKNIIITNHQDWNNSRIIKAYRSQFIIEDVFKEMKDRKTGSWWPLHHWTDSKIKVHALYCTIALLIRALMYRRVCQKGLNLSIKRLIKELDAIREVINIYPAKRGKRKQQKQAVLTKTSEVQQQLIEILSLK